jgi:isoleucyl-tRNA synthetase
MTFEVKPNFKVCGKLFGQSIKEFQSELMDLTSDEIKSLRNDVPIVMNIDNKHVSVTQEMVDIRINAKEGFDAAYMNNNFIILNTNLTPELINEGVVRELISKVQQLRKTKDFDIVDRINLFYEGNEEFKEVVTEFEDLIKQETLSKKIEEKKLSTEELDLNGMTVKIDIEITK